MILVNILPKVSIVVHFFTELLFQEAFTRICGSRTTRNGTVNYVKSRVVSPVKGVMKRSVVESEIVASEVAETV